nr:putative ribonuclease H-like domain-containing protein [Tanacetum cinerariifolium]
MDNVPVVVVGTSSTNISGTKEDIHQDVKEKDSPLRFIALPNSFHKAQMETLNEAAKKDDSIPDNNAPQKEQKKVNGDKEVPKRSRNSNPTASTKVSTNDSFELASSSTMETNVPTVSTPVPTGSLSVPSNRLEDFFEDTSDAVSLNDIEADLSNMETAIQYSKWMPKVPFCMGPLVRRKQKGEFLLVQVYVDDIIFGSSNPKMCREFEALMHEKFKMSAMGELNFFLGLQVLQKKDDIFLSQHKYVSDILKKFGYIDVRSTKTFMDRENPWGKDGTGKDVELHLYRSMIKSFMYLTASRPDIMFAVCACARHQVTRKECHLHAVKRIFKYLKDPVFRHRVYKVEKAMYGLHQALRAWYGTLSKYLLDNGFQTGIIDQTLFIRKQKGEFLLVQVYVDDIIFGSSNPKMCREFEALMHEKFKMSAMGELNFFLGLQVLQKKDGIFLSQHKYVSDILKKFGYIDVRSTKTFMDRENPWGKDGTGKDVELHLYRSMIKSFMY